MTSQLFSDILGQAGQSSDRPFQAWRHQWPPGTEVYDNDDVWWLSFVGLLHKLQFYLRIYRC